MTTKSKTKVVASGISVFAFQDHYTPLFKSNPDGETKSQAVPPGARAAILPYPKGGRAGLNVVPEHSNRERFFALLSELEMLAAEILPRGLKGIRALRRVAQVAFRKAAGEVGRPRKERRVAIDVSSIKLPQGLAWPSEEETYSKAARRGENIVAYLERVWRPLIAAGIADRRVVEAIDPSAITGIENFTKKDRKTGVRRAMPEHLRLSTLSQRIDAQLASDPTLPQTDARMAQVLANRLRQRKG